MTLRIYVAGASSEIERAERVIHFALGAGLVVTEDWPKVMRSQAGPDSTLHASALRPILQRCLDGVMAADALLLLLPNTGHATVGMWADLGYALALRDHGIRAPIVASRGLRGPIPLPDTEPVSGWARCFASAIVTTDEAAIRYLADLANVRALADAQSITDTAREAGR